MTLNRMRGEFLKYGGEYLNRHKREAKDHGSQRVSSHPHPEHPCAPSMTRTRGEFLKYGGELPQKRSEGPCVNVWALTLTLSDPSCASEFLVTFYRLPQNVDSTYGWVAITFSANSTSLLVFHGKS